MTAALEEGEWSAARPGRTLPPGKTRYPLYRRLGGPQGLSGQAENLAPLRFDPRTVQPVAQSLYRLSYQGIILYNETTNAQSFHKLSHSYMFRYFLYHPQGAHSKYLAKLTQVCQMQSALLA